jgi:hypothetical protein
MEEYSVTRDAKSLNRPQSFRNALFLGCSCRVNSKIIQNTLKSEQQSSHPPYSPPYNYAPPQSPQA